MRIANKVNILSDDQRRKCCSRKIHRDDVQRSKGDLQRRRPHGREGWLSATGLYSPRSNMQRKDESNQI